MGLNSNRAKLMTNFNNVSILINKSLIRLMKNTEELVVVSCSHNLTSPLYSWLLMMDFY